MRRPGQQEEFDRRPTLRDEELDPALSEVSRKVIGCAIEIHTVLGPGFEREVYLNALSNDLKDAGVNHEVDRRFPVKYRDSDVGECVFSLYVDNRFAVWVMTDLEEVDGFARTAMRQMLRAAGLELGLIINFHRRRLKDGGLVRVLNPDMLDSLRGHPDATDEEAG